MTTAINDAACFKSHLNQYFKKMWIMVLTFTLLSSNAALLNAYVLKGPHILELMTKTYGQAKRLLVSQKLILFKNDSQPEEVELTETLRYVFPEFFRSDIRSENAHRVHVLSRNASLTAIDGKIAAESETEFDRYKDILLNHSRKTLHEKLTTLGVDVSLTSIGRFDGKLAYILGAQYPDESISQIWVEKETFRPVRWLIVKSTPSGLQNVLDIQYQNWQLFAGNWYPARIAFIENGRLMREINVDSVRVNPSFSDDLFDINHLKKLYQPVASAQQEPQEAKGMSEIQRTVEDFKKIYE